MRYYIKTATDQERRKSMKLLASLGYNPHSINGNQTPTVDEWCDTFNHPSYPYITVSEAGDVAGNPSFRSNWGSAKEATIGEVIDALTKIKVSIVFPKPAKYSITYERADGKTRNYVISNPIEDNGDSFVAYAYERGIRTFVKERVLKFEKA